MSDPILAWHFLPQNRCFHLAPHTPVKAGETYIHDGPIALCESGLHASVRPIDALCYAPGPVACRVECSGTVLHEKDKLVCSHRKVLWMTDASTVLHEFACRVAEQALEVAGVTDPRCWDAIRVKREWTLGRATDEVLAAARDAAWDAARDAAWDAARTAQNVLLESMLEASARA